MVKRIMRILKKIGKTQLSTVGNWLYIFKKKKTKNIIYLLSFFFFFAVPGLELRAYILSQSTSPFLWWIFWDRVSRTIFPGWLWTTVLLISASWVAKIIGVSHWCPTLIYILTVTFARPVGLSPLLSSLLHTHTHTHTHPHTHPHPHTPVEKPGRHLHLLNRLQITSPTFHSPSHTPLCDGHTNHIPVCCSCQSTQLTGSHEWASARREKQP
jgi:hypothetical protein